jgi:hypothetical protein
MTKRYGGMLLAGLTLTACTETTALPEPEPEPGSFQAAVIGGVSAEASGEAVFGIYFDDGFRVTLTADQAPPRTIHIHSRPEGRPGVGTYSIEDPAQTLLGFSARYTQQGDGMVVTFTSRSGELAITESTRTRIEGTFAFRATVRLPGEPDEREVLVEGAFSATCVTAFCGG